MQVPPRFSIKLGFGGRLTLMILALVVGSIAVVTSLIYFQYRSADIRATLSHLENTGQTNAQAFMTWLHSRQDEMRYLASLAAAQHLERDQLQHLLERMAGSQGHYDTLFVISPQGRGIVGVAFENGRTRVMRPEEAHAFNVADRDWFRQVMTGQDVFSRPLISRSTGNLVSTVAVPIRHRGEIVGVMRGAVQLETILERVGALTLGTGSEIYLLDRDRKPITPTASAPDRNQALETQAAEALSAGRSGVGRYRNAAGIPVVGSYTDIPLLGWGLVLEVEEAIALAGVQAAFWRVTLSTAAILVLAMLASLAMVRSLMRTLGGDPSDAANIVKRLASGDMTVPVTLSPHDKDSLLAAIADMQQQLRSMIGRTREYALEIASAAGELAQINEVTDRGTRRQTAQITDAATAMNEMAAAVEEVARSIQATADSIRDTNSEAERGKQIVQATTEAIDSLIASVQDTSQAILLLKADSDGIGEILNVISAVAEQTNLLALNAAIEAARAGDNGRGFAVVAEEVRNLARRTQEATAQIQSMIEALQDRADHVTSLMEVSRSRVEASANEVTKAGESLERIALAVATIEQMGDQVAIATEEQTAAAQEINRSITAIKEVSEENARGVVQTAQASEALARLAEELRGMVQQFKT